MVKLVDIDNRNISHHIESFRIKTFYPIESLYLIRNNFRVPQILVNFRAVFHLHKIVQNSGPYFCDQCAKIVKTFIL